MIGKHIADKIKKPAIDVIAGDLLGCGDRT